MRGQIEVEFSPLYAADSISHLEILEVLRLEMPKPIRELLRIVVSQAESNPRVGVRDHGTRDIRIAAYKLLEFLMGEDEAQPIFAGT